MFYWWVSLVVYAGVAAALPLDIIESNVIEKHEEVPFLCKHIEYIKKTRVDSLSEIPNEDDPFPLLNPKGCLLYKLQPADLEELRRTKRQSNKKLAGRYVPDTVHGGVEDLSSSQHTAFTLGANPSNQLILNTFINANHLEHARDLLIVRSRTGSTATIAPLDGKNNSKFIGTVEVHFNLQNETTKKTSKKAPVVGNLDGAKKELGVFRKEIRGGITKERLIDRFIEVNKLPIQLRQHLTASHTNGRDVTFEVTEAGTLAKEVVINRIRYFGSKRCTYKLNDDAN